MTICCLCHANIIMPSAIWLKLSNSRVATSQVTKMSLRTPNPLYTHTWRFVPGTPELCPQFSIWGTLARLLTVKLEEHLASSLVYLAPPYHKSLSAPSFHDYVLVWGSLAPRPSPSFQSLAVRLSGRGPGTFPHEWRHGQGKLCERGRHVNHKKIRSHARTGARLFPVER